jgi:hypothetical protein
MVSIYISSTAADLSECREAVIRALNRAQHRIVAMESYTASSRTPLAKCLADVAGCDYYVGIFALRYGFVPPEENPEQRSITELEFRCAKAIGKPCLIFLLEETASWPTNMVDDGPPRQRINALRAELQGSKTVDFFRGPDDLAMKVVTAVDVAEREREQERAPASEQLRQPVVMAEDAGEPREVLYDALLAYLDVDETLALRLRDELAVYQRRLWPAPGALLVRRSTDFEDLEHFVCRCHAVIVIVSEATLSHFEGAPGRAKQTLDLLLARTGAVLAVCTTEAVRARAATWGLSTLTVDGDQQDGRVVGRLVTRLVNTLVEVCPPAGERAIGLPFVVVSMTHAEASELVSRPKWIGEELGTRTYDEFTALTTALEHYGPLSFDQRYDASRDLWKPFVLSDRTILHLIQDVVDDANRIRGLRQRGRLIKVQYYPFDVLADPVVELTPIYDKIARAGSVVVIDELSMFHPGVRSAFQESTLSGSQQSSFVTISPFNFSSLEPTRLIESALWQRLGMAFNRFNRDYDPLCELGIGDERRFRRWLRSTLPQALQNLFEARGDAQRQQTFFEAQNIDLTPRVTNVLWSLDRRR